MLNNPSNQMKRILLLIAFVPLVVFAQVDTRIDALLVEGNFQEALALIDREMPSARPDRMFYLQSRRAEALIRAGRFDEAEALLKNVGAAKNGSAESAVLQSTTGFLYLNRGRNDLALENLQAALTSWEQSGKMGTLDAAQTQSHLANVYITTGRYTQAEEQLNLALITRKKLLPADHELIAGTLNDLGLLYSFADPDKALTYYEQALAMYEKLHGKTHPKIAIANTNIAYQYSRLELFGDAVNNFEAALSIWNKVHVGSHPAKAFVLFSLGRNAEAMKNNKAAREYYQQAVTMYRESYQGKHPDIARALNAIGNLDLADNRFEAALTHYQHALTTNHPSFGDTNFERNPGVREFYDGNVLLNSLLYKAQAFERNYFQRSLRFKELLTAIRTIQSCDTLIDFLRQQIRNESDKIALGAIAAEVYAHGVRISMEAATAAWNKEPFRQQAFYFAEKSKAAVLLGAINEANAKSFAGIPPALLDEEKQLKAALALAAQQLAKVPDKKDESQLRQKYYELNRSYEAFSKKLETNFPAYYNLKYNAAAPTVTQLRSLLPQGSLLLSYFNDEKNNRLYIFQISHSGLRVSERALPERFDRIVTGLRNSIFFSEISTYRKTASELSALLLPRLPAGIKDLIIIPNAQLGTIPFETLFTDAVDDSQSYNQLPYLVRQYSVRYEFSSGLIIQKGVRRETSAPSILLCAPVTFPGQNEFSDLPATESEVIDITQLFASRHYPANALIRNRADEQAIKMEDLKKYSLLHFATHGMVDEKNPELSRIFLTGSGTEDGTLYAGEIYNLELNANLVTLSACQTGLGKISKGEGVIGLSRALVFAGARNCMVSFWKVADESTAQLMKDYYARLLEREEHNYSATLQQSKVNMINGGKYASPYYWAPFILIGF